MITDPENVNNGNEGYRPSDQLMQAIDKRRMDAWKFFKTAPVETVLTRMMRMFYNDTTVLLRECEERQAYYENERQRRRERDRVIDDLQIANGVMTNAGVPLDLPFADRVRWLVSVMSPADERYAEGDE